MSAAVDKAWTEFVRLRGELKSPGFCCGTMRTERQAFDIATAVPADAEALRQLRGQLHPSLLPAYPDLLTPVAPPTSRDVIDVLEQLEALSSINGISNTALFAMEVITSLVAMIDVEGLA